MDSAADRKSIRRKEKASRLADVQRREIIAQIMAHPAGRAWLWDLLSSCHVFATTFTSDALQSAFAEGQRNVGLTLLADIMAHCPDQYIQAMRESNERYHRDDNLANAAASDDERRSSPIADGGDYRPSSSDAFDPDADSVGDEAGRFH